MVCIHKHTKENWNDACHETVWVTVLIEDTLSDTEVQRLPFYFEVWPQMLSYKHTLTFRLLKLARYVRKYTPPTISLILSGLPRLWDESMSAEQMNDVQYKHEDIFILFLQNLNTFLYTIYFHFVVDVWNIHTEHNLFVGGLKPRGNCNPVRTWFHSQPKIGAEIQLLPGNVFNPQPVKQRGEKDKHLQTGKSVTETASLPHAEEENLLRQLLVEESWWSQEALRAKWIRVTPKIAGTEWKTEQWNRYWHIWASYQSHSKT